MTDDLVALHARRPLRRPVHRRLGDDRRDSDPAVRARLERMVELCPSGRLAHAPTDDAEPVEPEFAPSIAADPRRAALGAGQHPGRVVRRHDLRDRNRVTLCRCGHSNNKPFCDGTHKLVGFRDGD